MGWGGGAHIDYKGRGWGDRGKGWRRAGNVTRSRVDLFQNIILVIFLPRIGCEHGSVQSQTAVALPAAEIASTLAVVVDRPP